MPRLRQRWCRWTREELADLGYQRATAFCKANRLPVPRLISIDGPCMFATCAYYRQDRITIHPSECARLAGDVRSRNWNWPGSTTDREPYGVVAHETGHHVDLYGSTVKGCYNGDLSRKLRKESGEPKLTSYCPDDGEWFAEMMRLFITNHALLQQLRPATHALFMERWQPVSHDDWQFELGADVPEHIVSNLIKKGAVA